MNYNISKALYIGLSVITSISLLSWVLYSTNTLFKITQDISEIKSKDQGWYKLSNYSNKQPKQTVLDLLMSEKIASKNYSFADGHYSREEKPFSKVKIVLNGKEIDEIPELKSDYYTVDYSFEKDLLKSIIIEEAR